MQRRNLLCLGLLFGIIITVIAGLFSQSIASKNDKQVTLRPVTLGSGSGVYQQWSVMKGYLNKLFPSGSNLDILPASKGHPMTIELISAGQGEIGTVAEPSTMWAWKGIVTEKFKDSKIKNIRAVMKLPKTSWIPFFIDPDIVEEHKIATIQDIINKKVPLQIATWPKGSFSDLSVKLALEEYGVSLDDFASWGGHIYHGGPRDIVSYWKDRVANAYFGMCIGLKYPPMMDALSSRYLELVAIDKKVASSLVDKYGYILGTVPKGCYHSKKDVLSIAMNDVIIVNSDVPKDVVYTLTKMIVENIKEIKELTTGFQNFNIKKAPDTFLPLHPGATKYYQEKGVL